MSDIYWKEPEYQDEVKHKKTDTTGIVIAKYKIGPMQVLDVRDSNDIIHYGSPAKNWDIVQTREKREGHSYG
jgi:hypothetical protein